MSNITEIFSTTKKNVQSLLITSNGTNKERLFKKSIFEGMSENQIKSYRRKTRKLIHNFLISIIEKQSDKNSLEKLIFEFDSFYTQIYELNDYSFNSIASENTKGENKQIILQGLQIIKEFKNSNNKENNKNKGKNNK